MTTLSTPHTQQVIVRCLCRADLFKYESTGYKLGKILVLPKQVIQAEIQRRAKYSPKWYFNR